MRRTQPDRCRIGRSEQPPSQPATHNWRLAPLSVPPALAIFFVLCFTACVNSGSVETIKSTVVDVRSGPSLNYYPTSKLAQGDKVTIVREQDKEWLAIEPPAPGRDSFSWISAQAVKVNGMTAVVVVPEAAVRIGSSLLNQPPTVEQVKVTQGTQLTVIGGPQGDGAWLPILPPPREVRFIPAAAVRPSPPTPLPASAPLLAAAPPVGQPRADLTSTQSIPLRSRAEQADLAGQFGEAIRLYEQVAQETSDSEQKIWCLNRSQFLRDATRAGRGPSGSVPAPLASYYVPVQKTGPTLYCYVPSPSHTVKLTPPILSSPPSSSDPATLWYGPAYLHRTAFSVDGKPAYRLEPTNGQLWWYATAGTSIDLEPYVGRTVYVAGQLGYRTDWRFYYLPVVQVSLAR